MCESSAFPCLRQIERKTKTWRHLNEFSHRFLRHSVAWRCGRWLKIIAVNRYARHLFSLISTFSVRLATHFNWSSTLHSVSEKMNFQSDHSATLASSTSFYPGRVECIGLLLNNDMTHTLIIYSSFRFNWTDLSSIYSVCRFLWRTIFVNFMEISKIYSIALLLRCRDCARTKLSLWQKLLKDIQKCCTNWNNIKRIWSN